MRGVIDVAVATLNSSKTIGRCLESIINYVPYRKIVVVDGGSTDDTLEICKDFGAHARIEVLKETGYLGRVRYVQALNCETNWVAFIDSDIYVCPQWWSKVSKYTNDKEVGWVNGLPDERVSKLKVYRKFLWFFWMKRGTLASICAALVRRNLVLNCKEELEKTHGGEDGVVASHMFKKGLRMVTVKQRLHIHDIDPYRHHPLSYYRMGRSIRMKYGFGGIYFEGMHAFGIAQQIWKWCMFTTQTKQFSLKLLVYLLHLNAWTIVGFFYGRHGRAREVYAQTTEWLFRRSSR